MAGGENRRITAFPTAAHRRSLAFHHKVSGTVYEDEVLVEVGSVLLNAAIGTYAGLVPGRVHFGVPKIDRGNPANAVTERLRLGASEELLWAQSEFAMEREIVSGVIVICAPRETLRPLRAAMKKRSV